MNFDIKCVETASIFAQKSVKYGSIFAVKSVIEINFVTSEKYKQITSDGHSAESVIKNISLIDPSHKFIPGETLIFFDEIQEHQLYYYKRVDSTLEEDFFVRTANNLIPIEVKAKNGKAKSLAQLTESNKYSDISYGVKFSAGNIGFKNNIYAFPYYCTFLLKRYLKDIK